MRPDEANACPPARPAVLERLEPRLHLSVTVADTATPAFALYEPAGVMPLLGASSPMGLTPDQLRGAYGIDHVMFGSVHGDGTGQTIAIVDAFDAPTIVADLATFNATFNLPSCTLTIIPQQGATTLPPPDTANQGNSWALETSLDVEWAHAVAPAASILLVEATSNLMTDLFTAVDTARKYPGVSVVSMSWGLGEFYGNQTTNDTYLATPSGHTGVTFVAASGDDGAYDYQTTRKDVIYPAASAHVLAVGGTTLSVDANGNYVSEAGWGDGTQSGYLGGSGGGRSGDVRQPSFQVGTVPDSMAKSGRRNWRTVPDVAMDADPGTGVAVIDTWDFGADTPWWQIGGTSLAAPVWAGLISLADQGRVLAGMSTLDGPTQTLSMIYSLPAGDFNDITTGNNGFAAGTGYDMVTGRGTPIADLLVLDLVGTTWPEPTITSPTGGLIAGRGWTVSLTATAVDTSSTVTSVEFFDGAASLGLGTFSDGTWTKAWNTTTAAVATHSITAKATDSAGLWTTSAPVSVTVRMLGDANGDSSVDGLDYNAWQNGYDKPNATFATGDFNGDGSVDGLDYNVWQNNYNSPPAAPAAAAGATVAAAPATAMLATSLAPAPAATTASPTRQSAGLSGRFTAAAERYLSATAGAPATPPPAPAPPSSAILPRAGAVLVNDIVVRSSGVVAGGPGAPARDSAYAASVVAAPPAWGSAVDRTPTMRTWTDAPLSADGGVDLLATAALLVPLA